MSKKQLCVFSHMGGLMFFSATHISKVQFRKETLIIGLGIGSDFQIDSISQGSIRFTIQFDLLSIQSGMSQLK